MSVFFFCSFSIFQDINHRACLSFDDDEVSSVLSSQPSQTLTAAVGRTPSPMDDDAMMVPSIDREMEEWNPPFDGELDVPFTETIPMPCLEHIETEKLSLEKLPLDEEMEVVVKSDDMMTDPSLLESPVRTSVPQGQWGVAFMEPKGISVAPAPFGSIRPLPLTLPKQSAKRKLTSKVKVGLILLTDIEKSDLVKWGELIALSSHLLALYLESITYFKCVINSSAGTGERNGGLFERRTFLSPI